VRLQALICALCLALAVGVSGCGSDEATSSEARVSTAAATDEEGDAKPDAPLEARATKVVIGDYETEGPFAGIDGQKGNEKPVFEPSGRPVSRKTLIRDLEEGSGPAARRGDEVSVYYAGADHATGKIRYYGWPPNLPATFKRLEFGTFGKSWERTIEGMKVGGVREVIITAGYLSKDAMDYVIVLTAMRPQGGSTRRAEIKPEEKPDAPSPKAPRIGSVPQEGPFAAISDGKGNDKPHFDPPNRPAPKRLLARDIKKGSGPAARVGDTLRAYHVGALYKTGEVQFYGWPPASPMTFELGSGTEPELWKAGFVGLRAGGVREVVAPASLFGGSDAYDYLMVLVSVEPKSRPGGAR
jgi:FKBP-type peptidyl-prolyl cis-trans isomerase